MAYAKGSVIEQNDVQFYAVRINNNLLGAGDASYGYGQSLLSTGAPIGFPVIKPTQLNTVSNSLETLLRHQGSTNYSSTSSSAGQRITANPGLATNYQQALDNRLNLHTFGVQQPVTITSTATFNETQTITLAAYFGNGSDAESHNKARYFFNCGGQFNIAINHPNTGLATCANNLGSIRFGGGSQRIASTNYTGTTKIGGAMDAYSIVNTGKNFYTLTNNVDDILALQGEAGSTASIYVYVKYNGLGLLVFTIVSYAANTNPTTSAGSSATLIAFQPSTSYIANSWGPITMGSDIRQTSKQAEASELTIMSHWYSTRGNYVRTGLSPTSYPNYSNGVYGESYYWNNPHFRYYNGYYTELFNYNTASTPRDYSEYFTIVTAVTGGLGAYRDNTPTDTPIGDGGVGSRATLVSTQYKIYSGDFVDRTQPNNQTYYGLAYRISVYKGYLSENTQAYVVAPQGGGNDGSWTYQFMIAGRWGVANEEVDFSTTANRTLGPGRMSVVISERGGNGLSLQYAATPYAINYDAWWYNGGDFQINPNPTSSPINVDLQNWNSGHSPRVYLELSKDGGAATPTTTSPPPPPTFDPGMNPGYTEYF